ncbi:MAG: glycosyltransferase family 9 protein [Candidatus Omnitrophota bacterium]
MKFEKSEIKKILVISLSNIGDVILTFPVLDILKEHFPSAQLHVVVGPKAEPLLVGNPHFSGIHIFKKHDSVMSKIKWVWKLRGENFDLAVDLRNTAIPFLIGARYRTPLNFSRNEILHKKQSHLNRLRSVFSFSSEAEKRHALFIAEAEDKFARDVLSLSSCPKEKNVIVSPGAANHNKRWTKEGFAEVCDQLIEKHRMRVIFVGDDSDRSFAQEIAAIMKNPSLLLCGKTTLRQLAAVLSQARFIIANDSGVMHLASYLDIPTVAIFGPTDPAKYGPWSSQHHVVKPSSFLPLDKKSDSTDNQQVMRCVKADEVFKKAEAILTNTV